MMSTHPIILQGNGGAVRRPIERFLRPFHEFAAREASGGILLLAATVMALAWANSPWAATYFALWHTTINIGPAGFGLSRDLHFWINDGLMALFFFVVGLEIKREFRAGELASPRQAALPIAAAAGGVVLPALIYSVVNWGGHGSGGWGIPMATDIAFVMGVMTLLGRRVPLSLKVFMTALAIVDDLLAVGVIAVFYTDRISWIALSLAAVTLGVLLVMNRLRVRAALPYVALGFLLWAAILESGVHSTIAGVLLAMAIPCRIENGDADSSLLVRMERQLHPWVTFAAMPLFALANAGIAFDQTVMRSVLQPVPLGVVLGLFLGKPAGITLGAWLAVRSRLAALPRGITWLQLNAAGWLGGIGFTMSIFIAALAFTDAALLNFAKLGILTASVLAGVAGSMLLWKSN